MKGSLADHDNFVGELVDNGVLVFKPLDPRRAALFCYYCGSNMTEVSNFVKWSCPACNMSKEMHCRACGKKISPDDTFCAQCVVTKTAPNKCQKCYREIGRCNTCSEPLRFVKSGGDCDLCAKKAYPSEHAPGPDWCDECGRSDLPPTEPPDGSEAEVSEPSGDGEDEESDAKKRKL